MSRAKCHCESYESGGSLGVVSRFARVHKCYWFVLLEDKQKAKCGGVDKSQIYIRFNPIYLVYCIIYHLFWTFWCVFSCCRWCSSKMFKERAKKSIKEQKGEKSVMFKSMPRHDSFMPQHVQISESNIKTREGHAAAWPIHAAAWQSWCVKRDFLLFLESRF